MAFLNILCINFILVLIVNCKYIKIKREELNDTFYWKGNCELFNAVRSQDDKCTCRNTIKQNEVQVNLDGIIFPKSTGGIKCLYNYRETGSNYFLSPTYDRSVHIVNPNNTKWNRLSLGFDKMVPTQFKKETKIWVKEVLSYNYSKTRPFKRIPKEIVNLKSVDIKSKRILFHRYELKFNSTIARRYQGHLLQILFAGSVEDPKDLKINKSSPEDKVKAEKIASQYRGFTVVKILGDIKYNLHFPLTAVKENAIEKEQKTDFQYATYILLAVVIILFMLCLILFNKWKRNIPSNAEEKTISLSSDDEKEKLEGTNSKAPQDKENLDGVQHPDYTKLQPSPYIVANTPILSDDHLKIEPAYETHSSLEATDSLDGVNSCYVSMDPAYIRTVGSSYTKTTDYCNVNDM